MPAKKRCCKKPSEHDNNTGEKSMTRLPANRTPSGGGNIGRNAAAAAFAGLLAGAAPAAFADEYRVGMTAAMTGPASATYAPVAEALRAYVAHLNGKGGINGMQVKLVVLDDSGEPSKAAANAKRLVAQEDVVLMLNASLSSTYAPMIQESKRANVPLWFAGAVCPKETYPPADALQFCSTSFGGQYDSKMAMQFVKQSAKEPIKLGFAAMSIPISRGEIDYAEGLAQQMGMGTTDKEVIPPPTADYTPFATKLSEAGSNWVYAWAPWVTQIRTFESLRKLGWNGRYIAYAHTNAEDELQRVKDGDFYVFGANSFFQDNLPIHAEIRAVTYRANLNYPITQLTEGFVAGLILEGILKATGRPANPDKVLAAMNNLDVDLKGLRGGSIKWTPANHFRARQSYRVYRWDPAKKSIEQVQDWTGFDVK
jgi:branched-chain amino acid transport system substrate-binding protein